MNKSTAYISVAALLISATAIADDKPHGSMHGDQAAPMAPSEGPMTEGEVKRISKGAGKLTIKHGEIRNLDMPPMTMAFTVSDPALIDKVKKGDKVRFRVQAIDGKMIITDIAPY